MRERDSLPRYFQHDRAIPSPAGDKIKPKHILITSERSLRLEKVSDIDIQAEINSYEDQCCLQSMIAKALRSNDMSFLIRKKGVYADVSGMEPDLRALIESTRAASQSAAQAAAQTAAQTDYQTAAQTDDQTAAQTAAQTADQTIIKEVK